MQMNEPIATDMIYAGTPAIGTGQKMAQLFVGRISCIADIMGMHNEAQFINMLDHLLEILYLDGIDLNAEFKDRAAI